jgi:hypothetical protein
MKLAGEILWQALFYFVTPVFGVANDDRTHVTDSDTCHYGLTEAINSIARATEIFRSLAEDG